MMAMVLYNDGDEDDGLLEITPCPIEDYPRPNPWPDEADEEQDGLG